MSTTLLTDREQLTGTYVIDPSHSRLGFVARHAMVSKVRGSFTGFSGTIAIDGARPERSHARVAIQADTVDTRNADRDGHLRGDDFLAVHEHPEITFASTGIEQVDDATFLVTGDLTLRGVTRPVTLELGYTGTAVDPFGNARVGFEGSTVVNRRDWGLVWNAALETGGVLVSEKVTLELEVSAIREP